MVVEEEDTPVEVEEEDTPVEILLQAIVEEEEEEEDPSAADQQFLCSLEGMQKEKVL